MRLALILRNRASACSWSPRGTAAPRIQRETVVWLTPIADATWLAV